MLGLVLDTGEGSVVITSISFHICSISVVELGTLQAIILNLLLELGVVYLHSVICG